MSKARIYARNLAANWPKRMAAMAAETWPEKVEGICERYAAVSVTLETALLGNGE